MILSVISKKIVRLFKKPNDMLEKLAYSMMPEYSYENLLRSPHEYVRASAYLIAAILLIIMPSVFFINTSISYVCSVFFLFLSVINYKQGRRFIKYQAGLLHLDTFVKSASEIGASNQTLWLGMGFRWDQRHAQRMHDLTLPKNAKFLEHKKSYIWFRERERVLERRNDFIANVQKKIIKKISPAKHDLGGKFQLQGVGMWEGEKDVVLPLQNRNGHTLVLGTTRVGKTRLLEVLVAQDIRRGEVTIVIDPKGDAELLLRMYAECKASGREDNFHIFHLGYPESSESYNPIGSFMRATEVASRVAGQMPSEGQSATFKDFVWGYVNTIAVALIKMGIIPNYLLIKAHSDNLEGLFLEFMQWYYDQCPETKHIWEEKIKKDEAELAKKAADRNEDFQKQYKPSKIMAAYKPKTQAVYKFYLDHRDDIQCIECDMMVSKINYDKTHLDKLTASLQPFLDKLTTGEVSKLLVPDPTGDKKTFNWNDIIQNGGVVYVGLDALSDSEVAAAVGNSMFADLTSIAGRIYKEGTDHGLPQSDQVKQRDRKICIHADEFNELIGQEFIPMLNKAGGAGIQVTAYTQTLPDIEARLGSAPKAGQVIGNFNTLIMLRVLEKSTVELMTQRFRKVQVVTNDVISGSSDTSDTTSTHVFTSNVTQRSTQKDTELINPEDLLSLPVGQAFVGIEGNRLYKIRMPLPDSSDLKDMPKDMAVLAKDMREKYRVRSVNYKYTKTLLKPPAFDPDLDEFLQKNAHKLQHEREYAESATYVDMKKSKRQDAGAAYIEGAESTENFDGTGVY